MPRTQSKGTSQMASGSEIGGLTAGKTGPEGTTIPLLFLPRWPAGRAGSRQSPGLESQPGPTSLVPSTWRRPCAPEEPHLPLSSGSRGLALGQALHLPTPELPWKLKSRRAKSGRWNSHFGRPHCLVPLLTLGPLAQRGFDSAEQLDGPLERCLDPPALGPDWAPWGPWAQPSPLRPQSPHDIVGCPPLFFFF